MKVLWGSATPYDALRDNGIALAFPCCVNLTVGQPFSRRRHHRTTLLWEALTADLNLIAGQPIVGGNPLVNVVRAFEFLVGITSFSRCGEKDR